MKILVLLVVAAIVLYVAYRRFKATNSSLADEVRKLRRGGDDRPSGPQGR
ncbi:MAG: hypothetical protein ABJA87_13950 [bacterium]